MRKLIEGRCPQSTYHTGNGDKFNNIHICSVDMKRLPESEATTKRAHLMVPLEFPMARISKAKKLI